MAKFDKNNCCSQLIDVRSQTKQLQKEYHKPSSYNVMHSKTLKKPKANTYQISKTQPIIKSSLRTGKVVDHYQPLNHTYARRTWKRENIKDEQESPYSDEQVTQVCFQFLYYEYLFRFRLK